jgi:hypothetical protein
MLIFAFKLFISPLLIGSVTLAGRRWGSIVSGLLIGLPLTSAPISFILAYEFGLEFASQSAVGNLAGQLSNCFFCLAYTLVAKKNNWFVSSLTAISVFLLATYLWNGFSWQLLPAFFVLLLVIGLVALLIPRQSLARSTFVAPRWDLPARIFSATAFVILLTTVADKLGPHLSGLISPFPVFSVVFAAFTQSQLGAKSASNLLRGVVLGSGSYAAFFLIVGAFLTRLGIAQTYFLASLVALAVSGSTFLIARKMAKQGSAQNSEKIVR